MSEECGVQVRRRRSRAEVEQLVGLYRSGGTGRREFCLSHGIALSTLSRYVKKRQIKQSNAGSGVAEPSRLVTVELTAPMASSASRELLGTLTILLSNNRRVEVRRGFEADTLVQLLTVLDRL
jgi:transposase-like protein